MINFGNSSKLTTDRKTPDQYDMLWWGPKRRWSEYDITAKTEVGFTVYENDHLGQEYPVGYVYHILTYPHYFNKKSDDICIEQYRACLINPLDYAETLAYNYYGVIAKVSANSYHLMKDIRANLREDGHLMSLFQLLKRV